MQKIKKIETKKKRKHSQIVSYCVNNNNSFSIKINLLRSNESNVNSSRTIEPNSKNSSNKMPVKEPLQICDQQQTELNRFDEFKSNLPLNLFNLKRNELNQDANRVF